MGWELRRGRLYYYRKEREGSRVRSVYVGGGETAALISQLETLSRERDEADRAARRLQEREAFAEDRAFDEIARLVEGATVAHLLARGFHTHKRQWRLIRGGQR